MYYKIHYKKYKIKAHVILNIIFATVILLDVPIRGLTIEWIASKNKHFFYHRIHFIARKVEKSYN